MYLETMERVMGGTDKVVPFLPLDRLQKRKEGGN